MGRSSSGRCRPVRCVAAWSGRSGRHASWTDAPVAGALRPEYFPSDDRFARPGFFKRGFAGRPPPSPVARGARARGEGRGGGGERLRAAAPGRAGPAAAGAASASDALRSLAEAAQAVSGAEIALVRALDDSGERLEAVAV